MPCSDRFRRPRGRLAAVTAAAALMSVAALGVPSSAAAYTQHFCQYVTLPSGSHCTASSRHTLQWVDGYSIGSYDRVCAASLTYPWGSLNSDWRCDYGDVRKILNGAVDGVGAVRNGDPQVFVAYGVQGF